MIKERYVNLEVAMLLRDKGFDCKCEYYYDVANDNPYSNANYRLSYPKPTQAMACDWIEETFNISIEVYVNIIGYLVCICHSLKDPNIASNVIHHDITCGDNSDGSWSSKELAYNEALKYVLTNLV